MLIFQKGWNEAVSGSHHLGNNGCRIDTQQVCLCIPRRIHPPRQLATVLGPHIIVVIQYVIVWSHLLNQFSLLK